MLLASQFPGIQFYLGRMPIQYIVRRSADFMGSKFVHGMMCLLVRFPSFSSGSHQKAPGCFWRCCFSAFMAILRPFVMGNIMIKQPNWTISYYCSWKRKRWFWQFWLRNFGHSHHFSEKLPAKPPQSRLHRAPRPHWPMPPAASAAAASRLPVAVPRVPRRGGRPTGPATTLEGDGCLVTFGHCDIWGNSPAKMIQ